MLIKHTVFKFFLLGRKKAAKTICCILCLSLIWMLWSASLLYNFKAGISEADLKMEFPLKPPYNDYYEQLFLKEEIERNTSLGAEGRPASLQPEEEVEAKEKMETEAFNVMLSNKIPFNRTLLDARHPGCVDISYPKKLPLASVIIIFHNEKWSSLLRTVHSVLNRSPSAYLKEIIMVDDASFHEELKEKLIYYIETRLPRKVKLIRLPQRTGLIRARLRGAEAATADVLVFLDAHCEVTDVWLEPLLARIQEERKVVAIPIIDVIHDVTLEYQNNGGTYDFEVGGFSWNGHFIWVAVSEQEKIRRGSEIAPTRTPTMAGGLFAMDRKYFWEVGSYDELMDVWGGENLEMSFRVWQCGGYLETIPCSRVGHIFRDFHPYKFPGKKDTHGINTARLVSVWMDDYQRLFFISRPDLKTTAIGNLNNRFKLKKKLGCKSFSWYLRYIYPEKFILDENVYKWGQIKTEANNMCLDNIQASEDAKTELSMYPCHQELTMSQYYSFTLDHQIRREFVCAQSRTNDNKVDMDKCKPILSQKWSYTKDKQFINKESNLCLDSVAGVSSGKLQLNPCDINVKTQIWIWKN